MAVYDYSTVQNIFGNSELMTIKIKPIGAPTTETNIPRSNSTSSELTYGFDSTAELLKIDWVGTSDRSSTIGYSFKFQSKITINGFTSGDYINFNDSLCVLTFNNGSVYKFHGIKGADNSISFNYTNTLAINFVDVVQLTNIQFIVPCSLKTGGYQIRVLPNLSVSHSYNPNDDIINYDAGTLNADSLSNDVQTQQDNLNSLYKQDSKPTYEYQPITMSLDNSVARNLFTDVFNNSVISFILVPVIGFVLIKFIIFGRG